MKPQATPVDSKAMTEIVEHYKLYSGLRTVHFITLDKSNVLMQ